MFFCFLLCKMLWLLKISSSNIQNYLNSSETYALVTGADGGLGKCFCEELAKAGYNLVLTSENEKSLVELSNNIKSMYGVKTRIITLDLINNFDKIKKEIFDNIFNLDIGVFVNNVGIMSKSLDHFHEHNDLSILNILKINVLSTTLMNKYAIQHLLRRKFGKGAIINVGSSLGHLITPRLCTYSSSKSYISHFTEILQSEYKNQIDFLNIAPGQLNTNLTSPFITKISSRIKLFNICNSIMTPSPDVVVHESLKRIGVITRTNPYVFHYLQEHFGTSTSFGKWMWVWFSNHLLSHIQKI